MSIESISLQEPAKLIDLTKPNLGTLETFFSSEYPAPNETTQENDRSEDEFERRRKEFFSL